MNNENMDSNLLDTKPLVTIIMPVYGVEQYLNKAVASVVNQTYRRLQIILVDDGSLDNCPAMCDAWARKDDRVEVIHQINAGHGEARNAGIKIAKGDYLYFVDSDDYLESNAISVLVKAAVNHQAQIVICGTRNVDYDDGSYRERGRNTMEYLVMRSNDDIREHVSAMMQHSYYIPPWNKLYRRSFLEEQGAVFDHTVRAGEDSLFNVPLYVAADRVVCVPDVLYNYVLRSGSICTQFHSYWFDHRRETFKRIEPVLREWDSLALQLFTNEFIYQVGVILSFLYEDTRSKVKVMRKRMLDRIAHDDVLSMALQDFHPENRRNAITAKILATHNPHMLALYGKSVAGVKVLIARVKGAR
ncbi:glycosyltransferase family 2 protein [Bifidobacterium callimiconis]|uniref:glycosyltransferase family 2 protein n=1 Tax=Bifidobacterium callimiconis TaxID=2306973 RepID=UPI001BDC0B5D|nr:glycosyltransferase family 2 protein [Bifidobacterium callimiconis]MBT1177296.1 glycosyltransferase family 2 protein [Bifidobacterium callimiconis]